jgi:hypothetical protein
VTSQRSDIRAVLPSTVRPKLTSPRPAIRLFERQFHEEQEVPRPTSDRSRGARAQPPRRVALNSARRAASRSTWRGWFCAAAVLFALGLPGCISVPRPHRFEDVDAASENTVESYAAWSDGGTLVLDLTPHGAPYRGLWYFVEGGNLYLQAYYDYVLGAPTISTMGEERLETREGFRDGERFVLRYRIDMMKLGFVDDWASRVFWLVEAPGFLIPGPAVFVEARRPPAKRLRIVVGGAPPAIGY